MNYEENKLKFSAFCKTNNLTEDEAVKYIINDWLNKITMSKDVSIHKLYDKQLLIENLKNQSKGYEKLW